MLRLFCTILLIIFSNQIMAWENHAMLTRIVLDNWGVSNAPVSKYLNQNIKPESLQAFLNATKKTLPDKLMKIESWAQANENGYKSLPGNLAYQPSRSDCKNNLELCFRKALRINLDVALRPIIYDESSYYSHQRGFTAITDLRKIMPDYVASGFNMQHFAFIPNNGKVRVADVIATGSIQPDFGFDTFLYEDSQTAFGKIYGFGTQPLGNPALAFNSQMLFHMSAYHEDPKILALIPRLNENYPEYRAFLYLNLSQFAAENNHPYWAALFLGWGLHYVQDLTQPYHSKIAYGLDTNVVLSAIMETGKKNFAPFSQLETLQINRHVILENLTNTMLTSADGDLYKKIFENSLKNKNINAKLPVCAINNFYLRKEVSAKAANIIPNFEKLLMSAVPSHYVNDSTFHVKTTMDLNKLFSQEMSKEQKTRFVAGVAQSLGLYGAYTRKCVAAYAKSNFTNLPEPGNQVPAP